MVPIPEIREKEAGNPKLRTENAPKSKKDFSKKAEGIRQAAKQQAIRQLTSKKQENAQDHAMQEVDHAAAETANTTQTVISDGKAILLQRFHADKKAHYDSADEATHADAPFSEYVLSERDAQPEVTVPSSRTLEPPTVPIKENHKPTVAPDYKHRLLLTESDSEQAAAPSHGRQETSFAIKEKPEQFPAPEIRQRPDTFSQKTEQAAELGKSQKTLAMKKRLEQRPASAVMETPNPAPASKNRQTPDTIPPEANRASLPDSGINAHPQHQITAISIYPDPEKQTHSVEGAAPDIRTRPEGFVAEPRLKSELPIKLRESAAVQQPKTIEIAPPQPATDEPAHTLSRDAAKHAAVERLTKKRQKRSEAVKPQQAPSSIRCQASSEVPSSEAMPSVRATEASATERKPILARLQNRFSVSEAESTPSASSQNTIKTSQPVEIKAFERRTMKTPDRSTIKTAGTATQPKTLPRRAPSSAAAKASMERGRKEFEREARRKLAAQAKQAAKKAAEAAEKAAVAAAKAIKAAVSALAAGGAGAVLVMILLLVAIIGAIAASPFGIFFASSGEGTVTLAAAVARINSEYCDRLEELQSGDYDEIILEGEPPDWVEVVAVFACATASDAEDAMDVATLDEARIQKLREIFWAMCEITVEELTEPVETDEPEESDEDTEEDAEEESDEAETTTTLIIHIHGKTADEMREALHFNDYQNSALDSMLAERESLQGLLGDLTISDEAAAALWHSLPADLSAERKQVIRHALSLVGKVNYFWGGKSLVIGWDPRWGQLTLVTAEGSQTTGTYRPYSLDCSGFVDWVFYNASNGEYVIGHGGGAASQHAYCTEISWADAQPGDLVFYADDSHVGIVGGRDEHGNLQIIHCNAGANNVSISGTSGFNTVGRPRYYNKQ